MRAKEFITEGKKDRRDVKRTVKPRNPVAHAAQTVAKGSGAHKDKRKEIPRKAKHKTTPVVGEDWSQKYKNSINCSNPKGFSQKAHCAGKKKNEEVDEVSPPGWGGTVKAMKKHGEIDNPWALAWSMKNKGYKSHKKDEEVEEKMNTPFAGAKVGQKEGPAGQLKGRDPAGYPKGKLVGGGM